MIPPINSLVKYDNPILVSTTKDKKGKGAAAKKGAKGGKLPPVEGKPQLSQTEDILNSILPPRCLHCLQCSGPAQIRKIRRRLPRAQGMDRGWSPLGPVCVEYPRN
jgi:hypothetical protein